MEADVRPSGSVATETASGAWEESALASLEGAPRLAANQPDHGLVWVTRGRLTVTTAAQGTFELAKGSVVAYRLGDALSWSASPGSHVRWCRRDVRVRDGEVQPWTPPTKSDEPVFVAPRRRPWMALASVALLWVGAVTVAWCVSGAHGSRVAERKIPQIPQRQLADADLLGSVFADAGWTVEYATVSPKRRGRVGVRVDSPEAAAALARPDGPVKGLVETLTDAMKANHVESIDVVPVLPGGDSASLPPTLKVLPDGTLTPNAVVAPPKKTAPLPAAGR